MNTTGTSTLLLTAALALGAGAIPQDELPSAEQVLARYVEVTGGQQAYDAIQNRVAEGLILTDNGQVAIPLKVYRAKPGKVYSHQDVPQLGVIEKGATAEVAWEINPSTGTTVYDGPQRGAILRQAVFDREAYWQQVWKKAECAGTQVVDGQPCYDLVMTPKAFDDSELEADHAPPPDHLYFAKESGLLVMSSQVFRAPGEPDVKVESRPSELHRVDGVLLPFRTVTQMEGQDPIVTEIHSLRQNLLLMPKQFALPDAVRAIVEQRRKND